MTMSTRAATSLTKQKDETRKRKEMAQAAKTAKKQKKSDLVSADLICCISHRLMLEPVFTSDGRMYDKKEIEQYIEHQLKEGLPLLSPYSQSPINGVLTPSPQTRNTIEAMIDHGIFIGALAEEWKRRKQEKEEAERRQKAMDNLLQKAEGGDVEAMLAVASSFAAGKDGFPEYPNDAYNWYSRANKAGSVVGMAKEGECVLQGFGTNQSVVLGSALLGVAAGMGSDLANYILGNCCLKGEYSYPQDVVMARNFLVKACSTKTLHAHMTESQKKDCNRKLTHILGVIDVEPDIDADAYVVDIDSVVEAHFQYDNRGNPYD